MLNDALATVTELAIQRRYYGDEEYEVELPFLNDDWDEYKLAELRSDLTDVIAAAKFLINEVDDVLAGWLGPDRAWRYGDEVFTVGPKTTRYQCTDPEQFMAWLCQGDIDVAHRVRQCFNVNYPRIGGVRALDGMDFYKRVPSEDVLKVSNIPAEIIGTEKRAPKWYPRRDGEITERP